MNYEYEYQPTMANVNSNAMSLSKPNSMPSMPAKEEAMYPEVYKKMHPYVLNIINEMETKYGNINVTENLLTDMCDELIRRSGVKVDDDPMMEESVPAIAYYGGMHHDGHHHHGHHRDGLRDLGRIFFLSEIFGRRRHGWR